MNALSKARLAPKTNCLLAFLCLALLVLPFHPFWLDFEQVRRGLLAVILGLIAVLLPGRFASLRLPTRLLLCGILWLLLPALASTSSLARQWESLSYLAALVLLTMLSPSVPRATWAVSLPTVILLTSIYGIAQRMGIAEFAGYGAVGEPVSVFGNLNVAAEVTCVGLAACLVLGIERPRWSIAALVIGGAYLPIDGSRSSLVALPLAAAWFLFAVTAARMRKLTLLCALLVGAGCGFAIDAIGPAPFRNVEPAAQEQVANKQTATLAVRSEIRASCIAMIKDAPFLVADSQASPSTTPFIVRNTKSNCRPSIGSSQHVRRPRTTTTCKSPSKVACLRCCSGSQPQSRCCAVRGQTARSSCHLPHCSALWRCAHHFGTPRAQHWPSCLPSHQAPRQRCSLRFLLAACCAALVSRCSFAACNRSSQIRMPLTTRQAALIKQRPTSRLSCALKATHLHNQRSSSCSFKNG